MSTIPPLGAGTTVAPPASASSSQMRVRATAANKAPTGLWDVLTEEERSYFLAVAALGPVSYGPGGAASAPVTAPVGQRIDVTG